MKTQYIISILFAALSISNSYAEDIIQQSGGSGQGAPSQAPASAALEQKDKELLAQEQLLLKQVGDLNAAKAAEPAQAIPAAPESTPLVPVQKLAQKAQASDPEVPSQVKVQKAEKKAASPAPAAAACNNSELLLAQGKIKKLQADLDDTRNRLMVSETEVERLALLVDEGNRRRGKTLPVAQSSSYGRELRVRDSSEIQAKVENDMQIATVITEKAQLRTGPGKDNSPLMTVPQGTRLAVETRNGDWYRVISPTGARAWVSSDVIDFGGAVANPDSAARGKGFTKDVEDAAFEALSKGAVKPR